MRYALFLICCMSSMYTMQNDTRNERAEEAFDAETNAVIDISMHRLNQALNERETKTVTPFALTFGLYNKFGLGSSLNMAPIHNNMSEAEMIISASSISMILKRAAKNTLLFYPAVKCAQKTFSQLQKPTLSRTQKHSSIMRVLDLLSTVRQPDYTIPQCMHLLLESIEKNPHAINDSHLACTLEQHTISLQNIFEKCIASGAIKTLKKTCKKYDLVDLDEDALYNVCKKRYTQDTFVAQHQPHDTPLSSEDILRSIAEPQDLPLDTDTSYATSASTADEDTRSEYSSASSETRANTPNVLHNYLLTACKYLVTLPQDQSHMWFIKECDKAFDYLRNPYSHKEFNFFSTLRSIPVIGNAFNAGLNLTTQGKRAIAADCFAYGITRLIETGDIPSSYLDYTRTLLSTHKDDLVTLITQHQPLIDKLVSCLEQESHVTKALLNFFDEHTWEAFEQYNPQENTYGHRIVMSAKHIIQDIRLIHKLLETQKVASQHKECAVENMLHYLGSKKTGANNSSSLLHRHIMSLAEPKDLI
jgi:hypothetical protein